MDRPTFSQSWDRVGPLKPRLRSGVGVQRRAFRRRRGYVVHDPAANQFFRLDPVSYHLLGLLDGTRSVEDAWALTSEKFGDAAPTQNEVVGLLGQLYQANLVSLDGVADGDQLFKRMQRRQQDKAKRQALNFLFLRIPVFDPAAALDWLLPLVRPVLSVWGFVAWVVLLGVGVAQLVAHGREFRLNLDNLLRPDDFVWIALLLVVVKAVHEFGHGLMCRRFGGQVHEMGVMLLVFVPVPYCDATSSWGLTRRTRRAMVGLAGIMVELGVAAVAAIVWAHTNEGEPHRLAYNAVFLTGVASLLFNANPLLRYDGYYVLSDLLDIPNLYQRANRQVLFLVQRYLFGLEQPRPVAKGFREPAWLALYSVAAWSYRVTVFTAVFWALSTRFVGAGIIFAMLGLAGWVVMPIATFIRWLATDAALTAHRARPIAVSAALALAALAGVALLRVDEHTRAEAVIESPEQVQLIAAADGFIDRVLVADGSPVASDDTVLEASNPKLRATRQDFFAQRVELETLLAEGTVNDPGKALAMRSRIAVLQKQVAELDRQIENLRLKSPIAGRLVAPQLDTLTGRFVKRGEIIGLVRAPAQLRATAVIDQSQNALFFSKGAVRSVELRTLGRPDRTIHGTIESVDPAARNDLPHASLGSGGGGEALTTRDDKTGKTATEQFFEVKIALDGPVDLYAGQRATARFTLEPRPLAAQWWRQVLRMIRVRSL